MLGKDIVKKRLMYSITDYKSVEEYLEKMALKGYMLTEVKGRKFIFRKDEKRELKYNVSLFYPETVFDCPDDETREDFRQICIDSGWTYCTSNTMLQIFYKEKDIETVPIHTDSMEEYKIIKSIMLKTELISDALIFFILIPSIVGLFNIKLYSLTTNIGLFASFISPVFLSYFFLDFTFNKLSWLIRNHQRAKKKQELSHKSYRSFQIRRMTMSSILIAYVLIIILCMFSSKQMGSFIFVGFIPIVLGVLSAMLYKKYIKKSKKSRKKNIIIFMIMLVVVWIVSMASVFIIMGKLMDFEDDYNKDITDESNLVRLKDLRTDNPDVRNYYNEDASLIIPSHIAFDEYVSDEEENAEIDDISIEIYECLNNWIARYVYDLYLKEEINRSIKYNRDFSKFEIDNVRWNVDEGYYLEDNSSIIFVKDNRVIVIETYDSKYIDDRFIATVREKLNLN